MEQWWPIAVGLILAFSVPAFRWMAKAIGAAVVDSIGDDLEDRWKKAIEDAVAPIRAELETNGGESVKDRVNDMWLRFGNVERSLNDN